VSDRLLMNEYYNNNNNNNNNNNRMMVITTTTLMMMMTMVMIRLILSPLKRSGIRSALFNSKNPGCCWKNVFKCSYFCVIYFTAP
jgi:hypothetical protein